VSLNEGFMQLARRYAALLTALSLCIGVRAVADDTTSSKAPVKVVADHQMEVITAKGRGALPLYISCDGAAIDLSYPQPQVVRALLIFHGLLRNADVYNDSGLKAIAHAGAAGKGTLLITPQFLSQVDIDQYHLPPPTLRWAPAAWMGGDNALNAPISSFDAIDAILARLGDRKIFPNLKSVVLAGHSGGGQVMQRYAVVGRGGDRLVRKGIHVRYIIANPSSYVYFSPERPVLDSKEDAFTYAVPKKSCYGKYDLWKFGVNEPPPYVGSDNFTELEQRYIRRDVIYLLGTDDIDPNHPALDKTCAAEDEGPFRFFRGKAYFRYMEMRHPELATPSASQQLWFVPGVEHDGDKMLNSTCGLAALFDSGACTTRVLDPKP
jgi:pimeloyl-ACP methyl ester carboxylesterase